MKKGTIIELLIEDVEFPGYGIGTYVSEALDKEGQPIRKRVYVLGGVPGELLSVKIKKIRKSYIEGYKEATLKESDFNKEVTCPQYGICGGCSHQSVSYDKQLDIKEKEVLDLFKKANIEGFDFLGIEGSLKVFEYRNKMEFTFGDYEKGGEITLGMHAKGRSFSVISTEECRIVDEDFRNILKKTLEYFREKRIPHYNVLSHIGILRNLVVRKAENTGEILINLVTSSNSGIDFDEVTKLYTGLEYKGTLASLLHTTNDSLSDAVKVDKMDILYGKDYINEKVLGMNFKISSFSFFQTNTKGAEKLYSIVRDFIGDTKDKTVFDLYCGTGTIGQIVAQSARKVIGIEIVEEAVAVARENATLNKLDNCIFIVGDVGKVINSVEEKPDIIILDPPRAGVTPPALKLVMDFNAPEIIYVSCNPKSLVENLKLLVEEGYEVKKVKLMDMFPHTGHVETVVLIEKKL
ncbi:MAG TPA: 23S rRNA (uracil(1939)-C(5))-methyltransferase RlmD [Clostridiaceae bacterium]